MYTCICKYKKQTKTNNKQGLTLSKTSPVFHVSEIQVF